MLAPPSLQRSLSFHHTTPVGQSAYWHNSTQMPPSGNKRSWQSGGYTDQTTRAQKLQRYTESERLVLQEAAKILDIQNPFTNSTAELADTLRGPSTTPFVAPSPLDNVASITPTNDGTEFFWPLGPQELDTGTLVNTAAAPSGLQLYNSSVLLPQTYDSSNTWLDASNRHEESIEAEALRLFLDMPFFDPGQASFDSQDYANLALDAADTTTVAPPLPELTPESWDNLTSQLLSTGEPLLQPQVQAFDLLESTLGLQFSAESRYPRPVENMSRDRSHFPDFEFEEHLALNSASNLEPIASFGHSVAADDETEDILAGRDEVSTLGPLDSSLAANIASSPGSVVVADWDWMNGTSLSLFPSLSNETFTTGLEAFPQTATPLQQTQLVLRGPSPANASRSTSPRVPEARSAVTRELPPRREAGKASGRNSRQKLKPPPRGGEIVLFVNGTAGQPENRGPNGQRVRGPFVEAEKRIETLRTRRTGACVRCRLQRIRCSPATDNVGEPCTTCARISGPIMHKLPCFRYSITDSRLYDKGAHPKFKWCQRWRSWDVVDIDTWASNDCKTITVTQDVLGGATFKIRCREFVPVPSDALSRTWRRDGALVEYYRGPYAVADMKETAEEVKVFVASNIGTSIMHYIMVKDDRLLRITYAMAYAQVFRAHDFPENKEGVALLRELFQLWVAIRMESQSERIVGEETLGMGPQVLDKNQESYGTISITPVMSAQMELMTTSKILQPLKLSVLRRLQRLIKKNDLKSWMSIYLALFVLLHSCSILTLDERKQAKKEGLRTRYVFDGFIEELHMGAKTMIYYFHYCNKGEQPFSPGWMTPENITLAQLNKEQVKFLKESVDLISQRMPEFRSIRKNDDFENDWYFVSQLYETSWQPKFTV